MTLKPGDLISTGTPEGIDPMKVGDKIEVHMDGGIRSGQDIFKAVVLGAKSTYIGRAFIYGLGAAGEQGVTKALQLLRNVVPVRIVPFTPEGEEKSVPGRLFADEVDRAELRARGEKV